MMHESYYMTHYQNTVGFAINGVDQNSVKYSLWNVIKMSHTFFVCIIISREPDTKLRILYPRFLRLCFSFKQKLNENRFQATEIIWWISKIAVAHINCLHKKIVIQHAPGLSMFVWHVNKFVYSPAECGGRQHSRLFDMEH